MPTPPLLKDLHIRITSRCNLNCPHCYAATWFKDAVSLELPILRDIIKQAQDLGCRKVTFTGGEPLVSPDLADAIQFCLDRGLRVEIETNGILVPALWERLGETLRRVEFAVSYDGEEMRNSVSAPSVRQHIGWLAGHGCAVKVQTVMTHLNAQEIDHILGFTRDLKIPNRVFLAHSPTGNGGQIRLFGVNEWLGILKRVRERYPQAIVELPDVISGGTQKKCGWGVHRCEIMPNGDVTSCGPITFNQRLFAAGNARTTRLATLWDTEHFQRIRNLRQQDFQGLCSRCPFWQTCLGACRSIASSTGGDGLSPHPFCTALYEALKSHTVEEGLLNQGAMDHWLQAVDSPRPVICDEPYRLVVERQHRNSGHGAALGPAGRS